MSVAILTKDDLAKFKEELFDEIREVLNEAKPHVKQWLKSEEVRDLLKVSASTLQTLRINGTLTYTKLGGIIYYDYEHIEKVMKHNLHPARKT
jgi:hypothetical protein